MAIVFTCSCGRLLRARPEFAGKRTKCPHCGSAVPIPDRMGLDDGMSPSPLPTTPSATGDDWSLAPIRLDDAATGPTPRIELSGSTDIMAVAAPPPPTDVAPAGQADRLYKVLTHKDLGFAAKFDPARLEETLNRYSSQGWTVKSTVVMNLPSHAGPHDELVVILER